MTYFFIFGLPCSGSTLLSSILDSHPRVFVQHEDHARPMTFAENRDYANLAFKVEIGLEEYLGQLTWTDRIITSRYWKKGHAKMIASNIDAKFILITRKHIWRTFFKSSGKPKFIPLKRIFEFWLCERFIKKSYPHKEIRYSYLVSNPEFTIKTLCVFIGVPFEKSMLEYWCFDHSHFAGSEKAMVAKKIVNKSHHEKLSLKMVYDFIKYRFLLRLFKWK